MSTGYNSWSVVGMCIDETCRFGNPRCKQLPKDLTITLRKIIYVAQLHFTGIDFVNTFLDMLTRLALQI